MIGSKRARLDGRRLPLLFLYRIIFASIDPYLLLVTVEFGSSLKSVGSDFLFGVAFSAFDTSAVTVAYKPLGKHQLWR